MLNGLSTELLAGICSFLLAGNFFFIRRLIDKIDKTEISSAQTRGSLKLLTASVRVAGRDLEEIKSELKHIRRLETDVAVLKSCLSANADANHS